MKPPIVILVLLCGLCGLSGKVVLEYEDPKTFEDFEFAQTRNLIDVNFFSKRIHSYLEKAAVKSLPEGSTLTLHFVDIDLAGGFEPWQPIPLDDVRMYKDRYPPSIKFIYRLEDESGAILAEGEASVRDRGYMDSGRSIRSSADTYHHERRMIERWIRGTLRKEVAKRSSEAKG